MEEECIKWNEFNCYKTFLEEIEGNRVPPRSF